jgi:hypothetical protein
MMSLGKITKIIQDSQGGDDSIVALMILSAIDRYDYDFINGDHIFTNGKKKFTISYFENEEECSEIWSITTLSGLHRTLVIG